MTGKKDGTMDTTNIPSFQMFSRAMEYNAQRQNVIAQNVANADTPKYKARDLEEADFSSAMRRAKPGLAMRGADAGVSIIAKPAKSHGIYDAREERNPREVSPNGNSVVMEDQVFKMKKTVFNYKMAADLYKKQITLYNTALGK